MKQLLFLLSCILITRANEIVYKLSGYGQLVTSSTLRWYSTHKDDPYAVVNPHVIRGKGSGSAICRGYYQNTLVPGGTNLVNNQCEAYFFEKLVLLDDFQVLIDQTLTSRYEWFKWDIFTKVPVGAVAFTEDVADATFIAKTENGKICELDKRRGLSGNLAVSLDGKSVTFVGKALLLMELEPISYELNHMRFATWRAKVERTPVHLGHVLLSQTEHGGKQWQKVSSVVAYNATYNFYYGQLDGLIRALPTRAQTYGGGPKFDHVDFSWGLPLKFSRHRIEQVSANLMSDTAVNASVNAMLTKTELPYEAVLVAKFIDGQTRHYDISGTYQETLLANVLVSMGTPYFITNGTEAPTTTTTTTSTTTTTTTTTTITSTEMTSPETIQDWTTESVTLRPQRTTTPMPTEENPLLRFYPSEDEEAAVESNEIPGLGMMSDEAKHSERSSPMTDFHTESASGACGQWRLPMATWSLICWGTLFLKAINF